MTSTPWPFAGFSAKAAALLKKRPLQFLFLFASLAAAAAVLSAYRASASDISLEMDGDRATLRLIKVYDVSTGGIVTELERRGGAWVRDNGEFANKLLLALPQEGLLRLAGLRVAAGGNSFEFNAGDFHKFTQLRLGTIEKQEWDVYELPFYVRDSRSLFPGFAPVNWRGDAFFCANAAMKFAACCLCLLLVLAPFRSARSSGPAAPEKAEGGKTWSFGSPLPGRALNLGRPYHLGLVFLLTAGVVGAVSLLQVDPHHDGVMLKPAFDVAAGQVLFRDTFTQYGALSAWVQALAVKIFGRYLLVIRLLTAFTYGLTAVLMWLVYSRFLPNYLNTFSCLAWLFLGYFFLNYPSMFVMPWSTVFAVCSSVFGLYLLLRFLEDGKPRFLFTSGFVTALTFWFKINYGGASFLASLLFLAVLQVRGERGKAAGLFAAFLGGWLAAHALFTGWLAAQGSLRDFTLQSIKFALAFSGNNAFTTNEHPVVQLAKSLLQLGSSHGGISFLWLVLPLASCVVFFRSAYLFAAGKDASGKNKALLAVSCASLGLWLGYYPIPALFHMYLSSVLFFGPLSYLVLVAAERLGFAGNRLLVLAVPAVLFLPDFGYRLERFMLKMSGSWEKIEAPAFLRGMYVPPGEKRAFAELDELISRAPGRLVNLSNSGLYSLYKDDGPNFHKMYMDWGWNNSFLYPDYIPALVKQLSRGDCCVVSNEAYLLPGYIPVKVFPAFMRGADFSKPVVVLLPGRRTGGLKMTAVDTVVRQQARDSFPRGIHFRLKAGAPAPAPVESVLVRITSEDTVQERINKYEFEYNLLPKTFDPAVKALLKKRYRFDAGSNQYIADPSMDGKARLDLLEALSGIFLYEKNSFLADTFVYSENPTLNVYHNGKPVSYAKLFDGEKCKAGDTLDIVAPAVTVPAGYVARVRINYKGGTYQEENLKVSGR
ncbi:MAG: hypothetical protein HY550_09680 [Elusimicrobia bacterium]|nr:hypothetical protein [Elusimicrobiota bacterium]